MYSVIFQVAVILDKNPTTQSAGTVKFTDRISAEG